MPTARSPKPRHKNQIDDGYGDEPKIESQVGKMRTKKSLDESKEESTPPIKNLDTQGPRRERRKIDWSSRHNTTAAVPPSSDLPPLNNLQAPQALLPSGTARDDFPDLEQLRHTQDFPWLANTKKMQSSVDVRRPHRQEFVRVRSENEWRLLTYVLALKTTQEMYLVGPELREALRSEIVLRMLFTTINTQGSVFLWPVGVPDEDGSFNSWHQSAFEAAQVAMTTWVRVASDKSQGMYEVRQAQGLRSDPEWPEETFQDLVHRAFKDRFINTVEHPILRRLRGDL